VSHFNCTMIIIMLNYIFQFSVRPDSSTQQHRSGATTTTTKSDSNYSSTVNGEANNGFLHPGSLPYNDSNSSSRHNSFGSSSGPPVSPRPRKKKMVLNSNILFKS